MCINWCSTCIGVLHVPISSSHSLSNSCSSFTDIFTHQCVVWDILQDHYYVGEPCDNGCNKIVIIPICDHKCIIKTLLHRLHWYGFSPVCVLKWFLSVLFSEKALSQWPHWYDFSPKCVLIWSSALLPSDKALSHRLHWYSFSPVCALRCFVEV